MRVFKTTVEEHSEAEMSARLSLRAVTLLEVASVVSTVLITAWVIVPLRIGNRWLESLPGLLALLLMINSHRLRGETPGQLGFTTRHFGRACWLLLAPMIVTALIVALVGAALGSLHFNSHFAPSLVGRAAWGLIQQYVLQAFIYRRMRSALVIESEAEPQRARQTRRAVILTALLFAMAHAPNLPLMTLTFVSALLWTWVYERAPNLFALALSHGLLSAVTAMSLPDWMLRGMVVGLRHLVYQAF